eukprot:TRINITY_DN690_c4_g1_i1.p1 TRINITY_DN690_c4_g1~~TRINITY_DN690_c4_g1_i1.p1  ORF type:complete len:129 (+),score=5.31 TRINITY_DN690_c4_g1_i1:250-636(+)
MVTLKAFFFFFFFFFFFYFSFFFFFFFFFYFSFFFFFFFLLFFFFFFFFSPFPLLDIFSTWPLPLRALENIRDFSLSSCVREIIFCIGDKRKNKAFLYRILPNHRAFRQTFLLTISWRCFLRYFTRPP